MKIVKIEGENFHNLRNFNETLKKYVTYDNSHKKVGAHPVSRNRTYSRK